MLNRVYGNKQCDKSFQRGGHRIAAQLGAPPGCQSHSTSLRDAVYHLVAASLACDRPEVELCDDLAESEMRPTLQFAVSFIVRELMLNAMYHSRSEQVLVGVLLISQGFNRVQPRGFPGGIEAEHDADAHGNRHGGNDCH